jgi:hypothetical protein
MGSPNPSIYEEEPATAAPRSSPPGTAAAVTPVRQWSAEQLHGGLAGLSLDTPGASATPDTRTLARAAPSDTAAAGPQKAPAWLHAYTEHLESEAHSADGEARALEGAVAEGAAASRVAALKGGMTPAKPSPKTREASRHGYRRPLMLTPKGMAQRAGGLFAFSVWSPPAMGNATPPRGDSQHVHALGDLTNRPDNITPPAAGRPRLHAKKRVKKVARATQLAELSLFDKENVAPAGAGRNAFYIPYTPGRAVV